MSALMKGHKWRDHKAKMTYPAWVEIKHDEIRCHVEVEEWQGKGFNVKFLSFAGKPLANMDVYAPQFIQLCKDTGHFEFDCGFEMNGNFNDSYRWVRSTKGAPPELDYRAATFYLYDLPEITGVAFSKRTDSRQVTVVAANAAGFNMGVPDGVWAHKESDVDDLFAIARSKGYEGLMVKSLEHLYQRGKRSYGWLKVKPEDDADGTIEALTEAVASRDFPELGLKEGDGLGRIGSVTVAVDDGSTASPSGIEHELGVDMFRNPDKYIGQWCEFKFMERDRQGGYRHPVFHRIREAKV